MSLFPFGGIFLLIADWDDWASYYSQTHCCLQTGFCRKFADSVTTERQTKGSAGSYLWLTSQRSITDHYLSDGNYQATTKNRRPRLKPQTANHPTQLNFPPEILGQWLFPSHLYWLNYSSDNKICFFPRLLVLLFTDSRVHFTQLYWGCA